MIFDGTTRDTTEKLNESGDDMITEFQELRGGENEKKEDQTQR